MVDVTAVFEFFSDNPITGLIYGGILLLLIAVVLHQANPGSGGFALILGFFLILIGVGLYIYEQES